MQQTWVRLHHLHSILCLHLLSCVTVVAVTQAKPSNETVSNQIHSVINRPLWKHVIQARRQDLFYFHQLVLLEQSFPADLELWHALQKTTYS